MTQLKTIINNHMSLECRSGHRRLLSVKELIKRLSLTATIYKVVIKSKRSHSDTKGAVDFRLLYVCRTKEEVSPEAL